VNSNRLLLIPPEKELHWLTKGFQKCYLLHRKEKNNTAKFNFKVESILKSFLNGILLKYIPASLNLYSAQQVISCDVAGLMQRALEDEDEDSDPSGHRHSHSSSQYGTTEFALELLCDRKQFIERVVESPSFVDFIARHGYSLHFFQ
jgi:hypothetical protein